MATQPAIQHRLAVVVWGEGFDYMDPRGFRPAVEECVQWPMAGSGVRSAWLDVRGYLSKDPTKQREQ